MNNHVCAYYPGSFQPVVIQTNARDQSFGAANLTQHNLGLRGGEEMRLRSNTPMCIPHSQNLASAVHPLGVPGTLKPSSVY